MLVKDDPDFIYLIHRYVTRRGWRMVNVTQGKGVLELAQHEKPSAIALDIMLPGANGWDVLRTLKANPITRTIPVLLCTALDERARSQAEGADGYLHKPVLYQEFVTALEDVQFV